MVTRTTKCIQNSSESRRDELMNIHSSCAAREPCTRKLSATGPSAVARPALSRTHVFERWLGRTEGAADVFARFRELMVARGRAA